MKEIKLTQGKVALVDDCNYEFLNRYKWCYGDGYALREARTSDGGVKTLLMHRLVLGTPDGMHTDHIDRNSLNNTINNLRSCTVSQNRQNHQIQKNNTSGYKGVHFSKEDKKWSAKIEARRKRYHLGLYKNKHTAALAYNAAAIVLHGKFACLNILKGVGE